MKVAIATPEQAGPEWSPFLTEFVLPAEIRAQLQALYDLEDAYPDAPEIKIVTMNRTVLDEVTYVHAKNVGRMTYEDVLVWKDGGLVPLLELHRAEWLCHSDLGTLFDRGLL